MTRPLNILPTMAVGSNGLAGRRLSPQEIGLVSLVRPSRISSKGCMTAPFTPPLGLAYLAAILREEGSKYWRLTARRRRRIASPRREISTTRV